MKYIDGKLTEVPRLYETKGAGRNNLTVSVALESGTVDIPIKTIESIYEQFRKEFYLKEDVIRNIGDMIDDGLLPESAIDNQEFINAVNEVFANAYEENIGASSDDIVGYDVLLDDAFSEVNYKDFEKKKEVQR